MSNAQHGRNASNMATKAARPCAKGLAPGGGDPLRPTRQAEASGRRRGLPQAASPQDAETTPLHPRVASAVGQIHNVVSRSCDVMLGIVDVKIGHGTTNARHRSCCRPAEGLICARRHVAGGALTFDPPKWSNLPIQETGLNSLPRPALTRSIACVRVLPAIAQLPLTLTRAPPRTCPRARPAVPCCRSCSRPASCCRCRTGLIATSRQRPFSCPRSSCQTRSQTRPQPAG